MATSSMCEERGLLEAQDEPTNLRCRKCRRCLIDSSNLLTAKATREAADACYVWHLNVESLPDWVCSSVNQVHWTVGKINCLHCGARLGGFNFINSFKCTCGHDTSVHFSKSRVELDIKLPVLLTGRTLGHCGRRKKPDLELNLQRTTSQMELQNVQAQSTPSESQSSPSSSHDRSCAASAGDQTDLESSEQTQFVRTVERGSDVSNTPHRPQFQENVEECQGSSESGPSVNPEELRPEVIEEPVRHVSLFGTTHSKRERNRLKNLRRKQRKKERWTQHEQEAKDAVMQWDATISDEERESFTCAVCLDLFYSPYKCHPCNHVFCEPCLRTLAKNRPARTPCPLCRTLISHVLFQEDLNEVTKTSFPRDYWSRYEVFKKTNYAKLPLPNCPKRFQIFWGFHQRGGPRSLWQFPHQALRLDVNFVIISIYSLHWLLAFIIFCSLCYFFLL